MLEKVRSTDVIANIATALKSDTVVGFFSAIAGTQMHFVLSSLILEGSMALLEVREPPWTPTWGHRLKEICD